MARVKRGAQSMRIGRPIELSTFLQQKIILIQEDMRQWISRVRRKSEARLLNKIDDLRCENQDLKEEIEYLRQDYEDESYD